MAVTESNTAVNRFGLVVSLSCDLRECKAGKAEVTAYRKELAPHTHTHIHR
jgi:hypothetical protein